MKKIVLLVTIISIFTTKKTKAQENEIEYNRAVNISTSYSGFEEGITINPNFTLSKNKSSFSIGPTIFYYTGDISERAEKAILSGVQGTYQLWLSQRQGPIAFLFQADIMYQRFVDEGQRQFWNLRENDFEDYTFKTIDRNIEIYFGYGFIVDLTDHLYCNQSLGLGLNLSSRKHTSDIGSYDESNTDFAKIIKLGIGYRF